MRCCCRRTHAIWVKAQPDEHMSRVIEQGDFRPMAQNREAMADLVAILDARAADYARAGATLDTSGKTVEQSFAALQGTVERLSCRSRTHASGGRVRDALRRGIPRHRRDSGSNTA